DRFIDMLDDWVDKDTAPPPSRADIAALGGVADNGTIARPALAFPEVACPLGVYYPYPEDGAGNTAFAAFTGTGLEPRDQKNAFIDMNRNGIWDRRESVREAWQRLGLLKPGEAFSREVYIACVTAAAERLQQQGFFSAATARHYGEMAKSADIEPKGPSSQLFGGLLNSPPRSLRAICSSTALTMPVSSRSTKALATSTYSDTTTRAGTSRRWSSS